MVQRIEIDFIICLFSATKHIHNKQTILCDRMRFSFFFSSLFGFESFCSGPQSRCISVYQRTMKRRARAHQVVQELVTAHPQKVFKCDKEINETKRKKWKNEKNESEIQFERVEVEEIVVCENEK